ncbi:hypothetical protein [Streptomyces sp. NPDC059455]|uniref:hypothetical protein n=1 Tax=Streptomyces sp. NPDC059455 TaxID=3346837 RepID=UPI003687CF1E
MTFRAAQDRAFLAALLHRLPLPALRRLRLLVRPDTVLRWHRDLHSIRILEDLGCRARLMIRDRDGKFPALFDAVLKDAGIEVVLSRASRTPDRCTPCPRRSTIPTR